MLREREAEFATLQARELEARNMLKNEKKRMGYEEYLRDSNYFNLNGKLYIFHIKN